MFHSGMFRQQEIFGNLLFFEMAGSTKRGDPCSQYQEMCFMGIPSFSCW